MIRFEHVDYSIGGRKILEDVSFVVDLCFVVQWEIALFPSNMVLRIAQTAFRCYP